MSKFIVTTTINYPTEATIKFSKKAGWKLIVVGDLKTPHDAYSNLDCIYLSPEYQEKTYPEVSNIIGWNSIQRRNIGFIEAYKKGAEVIASVDDDNIPYDTWGDDLLVNKNVECDIYEQKSGVFDPLSITEHKYLWHRGYPVELLKERGDVNYLGKRNRRILVQADLWNGDPDVDATARIIFRPEVEFTSIQAPFASTGISPFNSQNTFLSREVFPNYSVLPFIGRMDDIWASYILQHYFPQNLAFSKASVYQARNPQDLILNLENEIFGYRNTLKLINDLVNYKKYLPQKTLDFLGAYKKYF